MSCLGSVLPSSQACVVTLCRANEDFAFEQQAGGQLPGLHVGALVLWAFSFRTQGCLCGGDFCKSLRPFSCAPSAWGCGRRGGAVLLLFGWVRFKLNTHRALPQLAAALQALACCEPCVAEEFGSALPSLIPSVGLSVKEGGISSVQSSSCDCAALLLRGLWCLIKHSVYFEAIRRHTDTCSLSVPSCLFHKILWELSKSLSPLSLCSRLVQYWLLGSWTGTHCVLI